MYCQFYHLTRPPFQLSTEHRFLWEGKNYVNSLEALKCGLEQHRGLSLLTGEAGSGKTTVIRALLESLDTKVRPAFIPDSSLSVSEFYSLVAHLFSLPGEPNHRDTVIEALRTLLDQSESENRQVLLVVDEAQQLSSELIAEIEILLDLQTESSAKLNVCLVGQFNNAQEPGGSIEQAFANHVLVRYFLAPCTEEETREYIIHRLDAAGAEQKIFTEDALAAVYRYSKGYPGQINIICDVALFSGFNEKSPEINAGIIQESAEKMQFPGAEEEGGLVELAVSSLENRQYGTQSGLNEKSKNPRGVQEPIAAEDTGRSYAMSAFVVFVGVLFIGGGYTYYKKQASVTLLAEPAAKSRTITKKPVASLEKPSLGKEQEGFDAVGYSPPVEDDFVYEQKTEKKEKNTDLDVSESMPDRNPVDRNTPDLHVQLVPPPVAEATTLQVEETLPPVAESKRVESAEGAIVLESTSIDPEKMVEGEEIPQTEEVEPVLSSTEKRPLPVYDTENVVVPPAGERQPEAISPPQPREVLLGASRDGGAGIDTVSEEDVVLIVAKKNALEATATEENTNAAVAAVPAPAAEQQVLSASFSTSNEYGAGEITATVQQKTLELQTVVDQGASTPPSATLSVKKVKHTRPTQVAAVPAVSSKETTVIAPQPKKDPQPEDVIDWLLKKKGLHAKK